MRLLSALLAASLLNFVIASPALAKPTKKKSKAVAQTTIEVTSNVSDATVLLDDNVVGETPLRPRSVSAKAYNVTVRKLGFLEYKQRVTVQAGQNTRVVADMLPFAGVIHVTSNHAGAQVAVDGKVVGVVPLDYEVKIGTRVITVTLAGFPAFTQIVRANPGEVYELRALFGSKPGQIAALPLEPEEPADAKADSLALVPLEAPPGEPSLEMPLEPVQPLVPPLVGPGGASGTPELALEGLPGATDPNFPALELTPLSSPMDVTARVSPAKPWYREWWVYAAAGGVVVVTVGAVLLLSRDNGTQDRTPLATWWAEPGALTF